MSNRDQLFFAEDLEDIIEHCGCGRPKGKKIKEQGLVPRGGTFQKIAARQAGATPTGPNIATQMAMQRKQAAQAQAAKQSAFDRMKAQWAAEKKAKAAALPPGMQRRAVGEQELPAQVLKQRRPFRPGQEKSRLMQGQYPRVGNASANSSALT